MYNSKGSANKSLIRIDKSKMPSSRSSRTSSRSTSSTSSRIRLPPGLKLRTRSLLTAYVNHNKETKLWITTIYTNQKAGNDKKDRAKHLQAFSFRSEHEARESAYVNAPPKLIPFQESPQCFQCNSKFNNIFRRPCHCRNCGVCICSSCSTSWKKMMIPDTYNTKGYKTIRVCKTCDYLATAFRRSLLHGDYATTMKLYMTGNLNLRCAFLNVRNGDEIMFPIHCAAKGGNVKLLSWLVDSHHCPIKMTNTGNRNSQVTTQLIETSKGYSVLDIAIENQSVDILQYLVNQKRLSMPSNSGKNSQALLALEAVLKAMPESPPVPDITQRKAITIKAPMHKTNVNKRTNDNFIRPPLYHVGSNDSEDIFDDCDGDENSCLSQDADESAIDDDETVSTTIKDPCVICYDNTIDCVLTPCGHQICCLHCSQSMSKCPVCSVNCRSIKIFRP